MGKTGPDLAARKEEPREPDDRVRGAGVQEVVEGVAAADSRNHDLSMVSNRKVFVKERGMGVWEAVVASDAAEEMKTLRFSDFQ